MIHWPVPSAGPAFFFPSAHLSPRKLVYPVTPMRISLRILVASFALLIAAPFLAAEPGLLFYLSGDHGTTADFSAAGRPTPTYEAEISTVADGARGGALRCSDKQTLAYRAPGNIQAQQIGRAHV